MADIVFVHGLGGSSHATWRHEIQNGSGHFFWPEELGKEMPHCGVWSLGYAAGLTAFGNPGMAIGERGLNLARELQHSGLGVDHPLIFITHSMGGLVIKALIDGCHLSVDPALERLVRRIAGIAFCGTPHLGSSFASAAKCLSGYFGWASQDHLNEMARNEKGIELLNGRFHGWLNSHPIRLHCFAESRGLWAKSSWFARLLPIGNVVPSHSAILLSHPYTIVSADHLELVKPESRQNLVYRATLDFIRNTLP